jgi:hypothetical protein
LVTIPNSTHPHRSSEPEHPRIDQEHDQGEASYNRFEALGYSSPLFNQDQDEEGSQEQQHQERVAGETITEEAEDDGAQGQGGEKRQHEDETEAISSDIRLSESSDHIHDTSDEDDMDPRPASAPNS